MKSHSNFLKAKDIADWLDVSESAIYKVGKRGKLSQALQTWQRRCPTIC